MLAGEHRLAVCAIFEPDVLRPRPEITREQQPQHTAPNYKISSMLFKMKPAGPSAFVVVQRAQKFVDTFLRLLEARSPHVSLATL
jgi:hypothetical protein